MLKLHTIALISHASKVMLKILQVRLQQYVNLNLQMFKLDLEKAEEPEIKLPTSTGLCKKQESSRKTSISALLTMPKLLTAWITINCGKFLKSWEYQTTWPASWEILYACQEATVRTGHGTQKDREAWRSKVHWVTNSQTWLSDRTTEPSKCFTNVKYSIYVIYWKK